MTINHRTDYELLHVLDKIADEYDALNPEDRASLLIRLRKAVDGDD